MVRENKLLPPDSRRTYNLGFILIHQKEPVTAL